MKKYDVWIADLNPQIGAETGKIRPVVVIQSDLLNGIHPSTLICPFTTNVLPAVSILRLHVPSGVAGLPQDSDVLIDQVRAIDNRRFLRQLGKLDLTRRTKLDENLRIIFDL